MRPRISGVSRAGSSITRRDLLGRAALASLGAAISPRRGSGRPETKRRRGPRVVVVGAGGFGGFAAFELLRRGARVTLLDAFGPGNSRASSGGETRVIRAVYGSARVYSEMVRRAFSLWKEHEKRFGTQLFFPTGSLWMARQGSDASLMLDAIPILEDLGFSFEKWTGDEAARRWPQIDFRGIAWALHEAEAGYLLARRSCETVRAAVLREGGEYRQAEVVPGRIASGKMSSVKLSDRTELEADAFVFACGPWLGRVFPEWIGERVRPTRQEVFFFGTPAGDARFSESKLPVWVEVGPRLLYGIPGNRWRGFKFADDTRGAPFDPTSGDRRVSAEGLAAARKFLALRFPALAEAPLVESRVCQYENSPDQDFIIDRHPEAENVVLAGGGSGHGFKHSPAVGERIAEMVLGARPVDPHFALSRFKKEKPS